MLFKGNTPHPLTIKLNFKTESKIEIEGTVQLKSCCQAHVQRKYESDRQYWISCQFFEKRI